MIYAIIILQVLDLISTVIALRSVSGAYEANPVLNRLFSVLGTLPSLLIVKTAFAAALWHFRDLVLLEAQVMLLALYCIVIFQNFKLLKND